MMKSVILATALLLSCTHANARPLQTLIEQFDAEFQHRLEEAGIPGGAYAIVQGDRILAARGHGQRALGSEDPIDADTVFRIASVSKTFAGEVTGLLVREGKLRWESRVNRYLPKFRFKTPDKSAALQIQHLLGQSSGLVPNAYDNLLEANLPLERILPHFSELDPNCQPGRCYSYQNILFSLVGPILEEVTGIPYAALVNRHIFQPLEMHRASVGMDAFLSTDNRALPHVKRDGEWQTAEINANYYRVLPAAGVNASATDLGKWLVAQMGHKPEVIPAQLLEEITRKRVRTAKDMRRKVWRDHLQDAHYGLGWRIYRLYGQDLVYHGGWVQGYVADIGYSPRHGVGLAILLNAESSVINEISAGFWARLLQSEPVRLAQRRPHP